MTTDFIKNFLEISARVENLGKTISWDIPKTVDKNKGDLGLLPDDVSIGAWQVPPTTAELLRSLVLMTKLQTILELGTSIGYSTMWLALGAKENNGHVYGTEIFADKAILANKHLKEAGLSDVVSIFEKDIIQVLDNWDRKQEIDFVFMDADKQRYDQYLDKIIPLLRDNGVIVVDNVGNYPQHMKPFLEQCTSRKDIVAQFLNMDFGLLFILKNNSSNLLTKEKLAQYAQRV